MEKQGQIQTLEEDIERLAAEHATSMEQLVLEVNKAVKERDEIRKELQIDMDAAVMQSNKELDQMKEQYTLLKENSAKKVGVYEKISLKSQMKSPYSRRVDAQYKNLLVGQDQLCQSVFSFEVFELIVFSIFPLTTSKVNSKLRSVDKHMNLKLKPELDLSLLENLACVSKPKTLRARKAIRETPTRFSCIAGLFICCKGNKN